jgi:hypothetical protein
VSVTADGAHTVKARATDQAGNVSQIVSAEFRIDATAPVVVPTSDPVARTVKAAATDAGSGLDKIEYRVGDGEWAAYDGTILVGLDEVTVQLRARDKAGNTSQATDVVVAASDGNHRRNVALIADPTASYTAGWNTADGLNDDVEPTSSGDVNPNDNAFVWGAWPQISDQWVRYDWTDAVTVDELEVYFVDNIDANGAGIAVPKQWKAQYLDANGEWVDVVAAGEYGVAPDTFNSVSFEPVTTKALRLALTAQGTTEGQGSLGIKEWRVFETSGTPSAFDVEVAVTDRCVAGKSVLVTSVKNAGDVPLKIEVQTPYGSKTVAALAPGKSSSQTFTTRLKELPAGSVTVLVSGQVDGKTVTDEHEVSYPADGC